MHCMTAWMHWCRRAALPPHGIHLPTVFLPASDVLRVILHSNSIMELTRGVRSQLQGLIRCV